MQPAESGLRFLFQVARQVSQRCLILLEPRQRDLFLQGPRRYQDFQESLGAAAPNTLSARLKALEAHGLVERKLYSEHPPRLEYHLTEKGRSLGPVMKALREWGQKCG